VLQIKFLAALIIRSQLETPSIEKGREKPALFAPCIVHGGG
jgi:hypothetical protein